MALREEIERQGNWLFKWRSYLPLLAIPILILAFRQSGSIEESFGSKAGALWEFFCFAISLSGLAIRCFTAGFVPKGTSGRNTQWQVAESLNTTGIYSIVRNPLYLGNFVIVFGIALSFQVWWLPFLVVAGFWLYYERIIFAEEEFLRKKFADTYLDWAKRTPVITLRFKNWQRPNLKFSFKTVLRREFSTFFAIIANFFFLGIGAHFLATGELRVRSSWVVVFIFGLITYFTLLVLKKKTKVLNVQGR